MKLHEYKAKKLLADYGVNVVEGHVAYTPEEAYGIASSMDSKYYVIKAQVLDRSNDNIFASTLKDTFEIPLAVSVNSLLEVRSWAKFMIGNTVINKVTQKEQQVRKVYIEKSYRIKKSMYLCLTLNPKTQELNFISSTDPKREDFVSETITTNTRSKMASLKRVFYALKLDKNLELKGKKLLQSIYKALVSLDALKIEISELIMTQDGDLLAKEIDVFFDDTALPRQPQLATLFDLEEFSQDELLAYQWRVRYIPFQGNISLITNGVGLGLAVADMIKLGGGNVAHLIDIGWNANRFKIEHAFNLIHKDPKVDGVLIYIYGGSLHCDEVARGIIATLNNTVLCFPLVIRLGGTNDKVAKQIIEESALPIVIADDIAGAAEQIIKHIERTK